MERLTRLQVLRVISYKLLHFLIKENILHDFLTECINSTYSTRRINWIVDIKNLRTSSEFGQYFIFRECITHGENFWWRKYYKYKEYYEQLQQSK